MTPQLQQAIKLLQLGRLEYKDALEKVRASGKTTIYNPSMAERFLLKKALIPVHKQMASRIGDETIQAIYKETNFDPSKL